MIMQMKDRTYAEESNTERSFQIQVWSLRRGRRKSCIPGKILVEELDMSEPPIKQWKCQNQCKECSNSVGRGVKAKFGQFSRYT